MMRIIASSTVVALAGFLGLGALALAQDFRVPDSATAGNEATISTMGSGKAIFYITGPGTAIKKDINLGEEISLPPERLTTAGYYSATVCTDTCHSSGFYVAPAAPKSLSFLVHPSRVPVSQGDAVSGVALSFDRFHNLVLGQQSVTFQVAAGNATVMSQPARSSDGIAWFRTNSGSKAGLLSVTATVDGSTSVLSARRVVQAVASDPCNLRLKGQETGRGIAVETDPVRDCSGNLVPDGTVVEFTASGPHGKSVVDAPVKQGVARVELDVRGPVEISAASGVVMGNEIRVGGGAQP